MKVFSEILLFVVLVNSTMHIKYTPPSNAHPIWLKECFSCYLERERAFINLFTLQLSPLTAKIGNVPSI